MADQPIAILLPSREGFSPEHFGAIALCVKDFTEHSRFRTQSIIFGATTSNGFEHIPYHCLQINKPFYRSRSSSYIKAFLKEIKALNPALVEVHNRPVLVRKLCRSWRGNLALHLHNDPQKMKYAKTPSQRQWLVNHCAAIYCVSDYIRDRFLQGVKDKKNIVQTIYNGLSLPVPQAPKQKQITFVGRLQPEKGGLEFVQALEEFLPKHPEWKGVIIGAARHDPDSLQNPYEAQIQKILSNKELPIDMRGFCSHQETMETLAASEIAVIPSRWNEAFGRTALEAMACGCATISSVRGGLAEVVEDAALPLEDVSPTHIVDALRKLIRLEDLRKDSQKRALKQAQKFSISNCTKKLDEVRTRTISNGQ